MEWYLHNESQDKRLDVLTKAVEHYCECKLAANRHKNNIKLTPYRELVYAFKDSCPDLYILWNGSEVINLSFYVRIMEFGVSVLDELDQAIFNHRFLQDETIRKISYTTGYSERHIRRRIALLPQRIAEKLILENDEKTLLLSDFADLDIRRKWKLKNRFRLTAIQLETFWLFILNRDRHIGRKIIAQQLGICEETLRDRVSTIIRAVRRCGYSPKMMNDAVDIAVNFLELDFKEGE